MHGHGSRLPLSRSIGHKEPKWYACQWELDYLFCMQCVCWLCMCAVLLFTWNLCQSVVYELREWVFTFDLLFCVKSILCRFCDWKHFLYSMWFACGWVRFSLPFWMSDSLERTYHFFIPSPLQFTCVVNSALHRDDVAFDWIEYAGTRQRLRKATRISHKQQSEYMKIECIHFSPIWKSASPARAIISLVLALMLPKCAHIIITIYISVSHQCVVCRKRIFVIRVSSLRLVPQIHSAYVIHAKEYIFVFSFTVDLGCGEREKRTLEQCQPPPRQRWRGLATLSTAIIIFSSAFFLRFYSASVHSIHWSPSRRHTNFQKKEYEP